jgi:hypothetical protein
VRIPITHGANEGRSTNISPEVCINWFPEKGVGGESLVSTHGATVFCSLATVAEVRGGIEYNDLAYFVCGNTLYEINSGGTATSRGTLSTSSGRVSMAHNGVRDSANQQIYIADGSTNGYIYDNTTQTLTARADVNYVDEDGDTINTNVYANNVVFLDGYFVFSQTGTDRFYITSLYDGTTVDENDWATAEGDPDELMAVFADRRDLFLFGKKTLEVWYNSGDPDNTFQRYQGGHSQTGLAATHSVSRFDNSVVWLTKTERGSRVVARMGEGYNPQIISTTEVNYRLSTYTQFDNAFSYSYQHEGHEYYCLTFPSHNVTEVYDALTQEWHQRGHTIDGTFPNRERYNCHVFVFGKHLFGDFRNGKIYELDASVGTIDGTRIPRECRTPIFTLEEKRTRIADLLLDMDVGIGDPNSSTDTTVWLSYSKDGGHTYNNEVDRDMGDAGEYNHGCRKKLDISVSHLESKPNDIAVAVWPYMGRRHGCRFIKSMIRLLRPRSLTGLRPALRQHPKPASLPSLTQRSTRQSSNNAKHTACDTYNRYVSGAKRAYRNG